MAGWLIFVLILTGLGLLVGLAQWWSTRPGGGRQVDPSRTRAEIEAKYGASNDIIRVQSPPGGP